MSWPELEWPLTGELVYNRCDDVQYRYVAAWAGGWMAMVSVGEWHEQRTVRLNYGHGIAGGRPLKVSQINGATLEDNVAASLTATAGGHSVVETDGTLSFRLAHQGQAYCTSRRGRRADFDRKTAEHEAAVERAAWEEREGFHQRMHDAEPERGTIIVHDGSKVRGTAVGGGGARFEEPGHCFAFSVSYDIDFVHDRTAQYENLEEPASPQVLCPGRMSPMPPAPLTPPSPPPPPTPPALVAMPPPSRSPQSPHVAGTPDDDLSHEGDYMYDLRPATDIREADLEGVEDAPEAEEPGGASLLLDEVAAELAAEPVASLAVALMLIGLGGWACWARWRKRGAAPCGRCVGYRRAAPRPRLGAQEEGRVRRGRGDGDEDRDDSCSAEDDDDDEGGSPPRGKASCGRKQHGKVHGQTSTRKIDKGDLDWD